MSYNDKISLTGIYQGRLMLFVIELCEDGYICKKAVNLGKEDKLAIHSIINSGDSIYLADSYNNKIYKYDFVLNQLYEEMVGRDPRHMCIAGNNMYVANFESDNISVIDMTNFMLIESIPAGIKPHDVLYNKNNDKLYICCYEENEIIEYSNNNKNRQFIADGKPMHMFVSGENIVVMTYFVNGNVHTKINFINIETGKIEKVIVIDGLASDFDYKRNFLYVINIVDKNLYIIDITKKELIKLVFLGGYPESLSAGEKYVYVTNSKKNQIAVINSETFEISNIINLGFSPNCIKIIN